MKASDFSIFNNYNNAKFLTSATRRDIISLIYDYLHEYGWKTTFNYSVYKPRRFFSKPLVLPGGILSEFNRYFDYCFLLSNNFTEKDEAARYSSRQGLSIYISVVLYWLLVNFGVVNKKHLKFCQGYFSYKKKDSILFKPGYRAGMHAWLYCNGCVTDATIWQQEEWFDFRKHGFHLPVILGEIPEGMNMFGFEEDPGLVKEYARRFARDSGMTFYEWVNFHKHRADLLCNAPVHQTG
ncbi:MAG: hypothetical protein CVU89_12635 [Firmicutes bacterium HGW-Firmicutes-14]|nr:MAG: hypothetical protein CVU89_12635 [Firmicutes bacterium HGW-Firmicutes-14]